jgi:hypothetical protein
MTDNTKETLMPTGPDYNVPAYVEPDEGDPSPKLTFFGLTTTSGPQKYRVPASIAVDGGEGRMHFLPLSDNDLRKLIVDGQTYLEEKRSADAHR